MEKVLIINADDYGLTASVSTGIRKAHLEGILTSTTVMVTGLTVTEDIVLLKEQCPKIGIGLHLTLTNLPSIQDKSRIKSLIGEDGNFLSLPELIDTKDSIIVEELYLEWKSQLQRLISYGVDVTHLDSHHYTSFISSTTIDVTAEIAKEFNLPVRTPKSPNQNQEIDAYGLKIMEENGIMFPRALYIEFTREKGKKEIFIDLLQKI